MPFALSRRDLLLLLVLTVLWGLNWPVMKAGVREFPPLTFRTIAMAGGVVLLAAMARSQSMSLRIERRDWWELAWLALTNMTGWYVLSIYGVALLSSGRAAILGYTMPVWTAVLGFVVFRERLAPRLLLGIVSAAAAITLLLASEIGALTGRPVGALLMLGAALIWGLGTQLMRRRRIRGPVIVLTFWMLVQAVIVCTAVAWLLERDRWVRAPNAVEWGAILYNIFLVFGVCQLLWFRLATILPPVASSLSVMMIPVLGLFSGMWLLNEVPTWHDFAALGFILVAIATVLWPARSAPASPVAGGAVR